MSETAIPKDIQNLIFEFAPEKLASLLRRLAEGFKIRDENLQAFLRPELPFDYARQLGIIELPGEQSVLVAAVHVTRELTSRTGKKVQYELAKRILRDKMHDAGIFAFYDDAGHFRLSLVTVSYSGTRRTFSTFRRYTFYVAPDLPNKTFVTQLRDAKFSSLDAIREAFSLEAVSDAFYKEFEPTYKKLADNVQGPGDFQLKKDFALLFVIRVIFLGFVQKKGWLGSNTRFLQDFWKEYTSSNHPENTFYTQWLEPLFFEALNKPPGHVVAYGNAPFSKETQEAFQMAPYLNGELFKRKPRVDDQGLWIPDTSIGEFFDFLFQYNFTIEENTLYDEELELNPEFLGIIFERITNMDQGAVYTPRVEVDFMCRIALVKWLEQTTTIDKEELYRLFFREGGGGETYDDVQKQGDFSPAEIRTLIDKLETVTVCDPAAGSGAFEVGMLQVLEETLENLYSRNNTPPELKAKAPTPMDRKKAIVEKSLYGVEVKQWAVWINHLRLWLTLFVDMPDEFRHSFSPLLPNLTFKVRVGDSLVQRLGGKTFPVRGRRSHLFTPSTRNRIKTLQENKRKYFNNQYSNATDIEKEEIDVFSAILDDLIAERRQKVRYLRTRTLGSINSQEYLFEHEAQLSTAKRANERQKDEEEIEQLEEELRELEEQKRNLKIERPFLWNIEFPEIFFDRGGFDIIIGNPPYVRQEKITDPNGRLSPDEYKEALGEMVQSDFPAHFGPVRSNKQGSSSSPKKLSLRSDLYTYFYIRSLHLLNPSGVHVFICSNSWLDVDYGAWLQEFFLTNAPLYFVIDNHARRSFARADVNTVITVASAPGNVPAQHLVRFVAFKQPFEDAVITENLLAIEKARSTFKTDAFRVFPMAVGDLIAEGREGHAYVGDKWGGKYLRAPEVFWKLLESNRATPLRDKAQVIGYVHDNNISPKYPPVPCIRSIKDCHKIRITEESAKLVGINPCGNSLLRADLLVPRTFGSVHIVLWNSERRVVGKEFYRILAINITPKKLALLLNSTVSILQREIIGLHNLGGGALKLSSKDVRSFLVPEVSEHLLSDSVFENFLNRDVFDVFTECGIDPESDVPIAEQEPKPLPDRKALDDIVFDALGLTEDERKEVYRAVCQLVWERTSKARSV
jgi:methylase of polypeptide subunit release factors